MPKIRKLTIADVTFTVECLGEDISVRGNAMASGDPEFDREVEAKIIAQLDGGNPWAWCTVRVTAVYKSFRGTDYLGACSYKSEEDFREAGGYFDDMCQAALADLNNEIARTALCIPHESDKPGDAS